MVSNASSTATVVPCRDQKMKIPGVVVGVRVAAAATTGGGGGGASGSGSGSRTGSDEDSLCSGPYYSARSSFSNEQSS